MIRSMTGYGAASGHVGARRVSVEIRSVNHRFFNATIRLPNELSRWEGEVRETLRKKVSRGHVTLSARSESSDVASLSVDEAKFASYVELMRRLQARHGLGGSIDAAAILRFPDVMASAPEADDSNVAELVALVDEAVESLGASRAEEGRRLADFLLERLTVVEGALARVIARVPERLIAHRDRLRTAVKELTDGIVIDEQRLAVEIALLAERLDVEEEMSRFASHNLSFRKTLGSSGEPVGKRLGFLLQEMLREANTTGSKANDATILGDVVIIKEELERLREQVENLE
ncbi:MAG: YicC family protein [Cytophagaceae bacterium]|nr:YicC family protein [Gemmatimonadaceae bacterium]